MGRDPDDRGAMHPNPGTVRAGVRPQHDRLIAMDADVDRLATESGRSREMPGRGNRGREADRIVGVVCRHMTIKPRGSNACQGVKDVTFVTGRRDAGQEAGEDHYA